MPDNDEMKAITCGIVMPISAIDGVSADHWTEVKHIIIEACASIDQPKFEAKLVSDSNDTEVLHKRIIQGVYSSDLVICDVSGRNANVMFELGLRLAFDKPTIVIKDFDTPFSFDSSPIEHLEYPRNLRYTAIVAFKQQLAEKVKKVQAASTGANYQTFLKSFGPLTTVTLEEKTVPADQVILETLTQLQSDIAAIRLDVRKSRARTSPSFQKIRVPQDRETRSSPPLPPAMTALIRAESIYGRDWWKDPLMNETAIQHLRASTDLERDFDSVEEFHRFAGRVLSLLRSNPNFVEQVRKGM